MGELALASVGTAALLHEVLAEGALGLGGPVTGSEVLGGFDGGVEVAVVVVVGRYVGVGVREGLARPGGSEQL